MDGQGAPKRDPMSTSDPSLLCLLKTSLFTEISTKPREGEKGEKRHNLIFSQLSTLGVGEDP